MIFIEKIWMIDPFSGHEKTTSLIIENGKIKAIGENLKKPAHLKVISGKDRILFPGLIDLHTHLREPGFEYKEDIESGSKAALHGGYTTITSFPNTRPVLDSVEQIKKINQIIKNKAAVRVLPVASITKGLSGIEINNIEALAKEGAFAFTDDGKGIQNAEILLSAMEKIKEINGLILLHTEDESLVNKGVINLGEISRKLKIPGIPAEAEEIMLLRDIALAKRTGAKTHFCHISTSFGARMIGAAKEAGVSITAETAPHYLCFTENMIQSIQDSNKKMNPPLRTEQDRLRLIEALKNGWLDAIATDHAPHSKEEKTKSILESPFGIIGLETALPLLYTYLIKQNQISFYKIIESLTRKPAEILGLNFYPIKEGNDLNFVIFNKIEKSELNDSFFYSKSRNFPLFGEKLDGKIEFVFYGKDCFDLRNSPYQFF